jgi:hypothetical protein
MVKRRYYRIRDGLTRIYQVLSKAAKARGETTCPGTGEPLIDLSQEALTVRAALSKKTLLVRNTTIHSNGDFILTVDTDAFSAARRSAMTNAF